MSNNEAEIQAAHDLIESGVVKQVIDIGLDCYFAKLDERKARELEDAGRTFELAEGYEKVEPGTLMMIGEDGKLQQASMPPVLELLKTSKVGAMFQMEEGGLAPAQSRMLSFESVRRQIITYHFHRPFICACMSFRTMTLFAPNTGKPLIDSDSRYYMSGPTVVDTEIEKIYEGRLFEIATWEWKSLQSASPLVSHVEEMGSI